MFSNIDLNYINLLSRELKGFKHSNKKYNFRCPYCGDSTKSLKKQRGWLINFNNETFFKCFNCGITKNFKTFLKDIDISLYNQYIFDVFDDKSFNNNNIESNTESISITKQQLESCPYLISCSKLNKGQLYLRKRKISCFDRFYYTEKYGKVLEFLNLKKYESEFDNENDSIIIPHYNRDNTIAFLQFRFLNGNIRYRTYRIDEKAPKVWGLEKLDLNKPIFISEGAFDASFLDNGIAMSGADLSDCVLLNNYKENIYMILDNEPYNEQILNRYDKLVKNGYKIFIWPNVPEKDINEYFLSYGNVNIFSDKSRYFSGIMADWELAKWRKITKR